ncbi:hypothetical protein D3C71_1275400 [compost metagenome]
MNMQRLPLGQRHMGLQRNNHAFGWLWRCVSQQPVAACDLFFFCITRDVQGNTLPGMSLVSWLILGVQTAHAHRFVHPREPQAVAHLHFTAERRSGNHQPGPFHRKCPVYCQAKAVISGRFACGKLQQMVA